MINVCFLGRRRRQTQTWRETLMLNLCVHFILCLTRNNDAFRQLVQHSKERIEHFLKKAKKSRLRITTANKQTALEFLVSEEKECTLVVRKRKVSQI